MSSEDQTGRGKFAAERGERHAMIGVDLAGAPRGTGRPEEAARLRGESHLARDCGIEEAAPCEVSVP